MTSEAVMIHALHGNAGMPDDLLPLLQAVGQSFQAWHLWQWLREHPGSESYAEFGVDLNQFAGEPPRILLGYSLGGRLALGALASQPRRWDAAVFISTHPGLTDESERAPRLENDLAWAARFRDRPWEEVIGAWNAQPVLAGVAPGHQAEVAEWRTEVSRSFDAWSLARQPDQRPFLPAITCPVLWVTGEQDARFTQLAAAVAGCSPRGEHRVIPGAGHRVHLDQPEATAACIREFLTGITC